MKRQPVARVLHARLTKRGLNRVIAKTIVIDRRDLDKLSPDALARFITIEPIKMSRGGRVTVGKKSRRRQSYWARVKKEIHIFLCTNDKKYAGLRRQISGMKSQTVIVGALSVGIADYIGVVPGMIIPFVAIGLRGFIEMNINVYCAGQEASHATRSEHMQQ